MTRETLPIAAVLGVLAFADPKEARAQDVQAAIKELGLTVSPAKDQTAVQQKADEKPAPRKPSTRSTPRKSRRPRKRAVPGRAR
jgi:hypothetical protein